MPLYEQGIGLVRQMDIGYKDPSRFSTVLEEYADCLKQAGKKELVEVIKKEASNLKQAQPAGLSPEPFQRSTERFKHQMEFQMHQIPYQTVNDHWKEFYSASREQIYDRLKPLHLQQTFLMHYLLDIEKKNFNNAEQATLYCIGGLVVGVMLQECPGVAVDEQMVKKVVGHEASLLEQWDGLTPDQLMAALEPVIMGHDQPEILCFVLVALKDTVKADPDLRSENLGRMFFHTKIALDCLLVAARMNLG